MNQEETLLELLKYLDSNHIDYFLTGSFASNLYGIPRMTQDADIIVRASLHQLLTMAKKLERDFYVSEEAIKEAVVSHRMFNVVHFQKGYKFDLIPLTQTDFDQSRFERRVAIELHERPIYFSSAEDIILAKLQWASLSESNRQIEDAKGIVEVQMEKLDWNYLERWASRLHLEDYLEKIRPSQA